MNKIVNDIWEKNYIEIIKHLFIPHVLEVSMTAKNKIPHVLILHSEGLDKNKIPDKIAGHPVEFELTSLFRLV
jgi:hypothetical protein